MKKVQIILLAIIGLFVAVGCEKNKTDDPQRPVLDTTTTKVDTTTITDPKTENPKESDVVVDPTHDGTLTIEVSNITASTADITIKSTNATEYYIFGIDTYANWVRLGYNNSDDYAMTDDFNYWLSYYEENKDAFAQYYNVNSFEEAYLYNGNVEGSVDELQPTTEYIAYAYYVVLSTTDTTLYGLTTKRFTTGEATMSDVTFKIEKLNSDSIRVTPSNDEPYYVAVVDEETFYGSLEEGGAGGNKQAAFDQEIAFQQMVGGYTGSSMEPYTGVQTINVAKMIFLDGIHHILVAGWNGQYRTTEEVTELVMNISSHIDYEHPTPSYIKSKKTSINRRSVKHTISK